MAKKFTIEAEKREALGTGWSRRMRREGLIPAVLYGHGANARSLTLSGDTASALLGHTGLVSVQIAGRKTPISAILKDTQRHVISGALLHVDLQEVKADQVVTSTIVIEPHGEPEGARHGGLLEQMVHELEIRCLPDEMVESVEVDVSGLELDSTLLVRDIAFPPGITPTADADLAVFQVRTQRVEEELEDEGEEGVEAAEGGEEDAGAAAEGDAAE